jgi:hypothetical protein
MTAIYDPTDHADEPTHHSPAEILTHLRDCPGIDHEQARELWWSGPPAAETGPSDLATLAQHSSDLFVLTDLLLDVCLTIERGASIALDRLTALRRACAGLPDGLTDWPDEPLTRELIATANVARALTRLIESDRVVPPYAAIVIGALIQLTEAS